MYKAGPSSRNQINLDEHLRDLNFYLRGADRVAQAIAQKQGGGTSKKVLSYDKKQGNAVLDPGCIVDTTVTTVQSSQNSATVQSSQNTATVIDPPSIGQETGWEVIVTPTPSPTPSPTQSPIEMEVERLRELEAEGVDVGISQLQALTQAQKVRATGQLRL